METRERGGGEGRARRALELRREGELAEHCADRVAILLCSLSLSLHSSFEKRAQRACWDWAEEFAVGIRR